VTGPAHQAPGIVARWAGRRRTAVCGECGEPAAVAGTSCALCGQLPGEPVGMLATVIDTPAGPRLVIATRIGGGWVPVRAVEATSEALRMVRRQHDTGRATAAGGLW
jgi:hypothetical protein